MESLREALGTCAGSHEAASSRPDAKELSPSSSSSPALTETSAPALAADASPSTSPALSGTAPRASSLTAGGKSSSGSSPVEPLRVLPSGFTDRLASHLPWVATSRPELVNFYLEQYDDAELCEAIGDPTSLSDLAREITDYVRDEIAGEDTAEEEDSLMQSGQGLGGRGWSGASLPSDEGSLDPNTQDSMLCEYDFSATKANSQRDRSPSSERSLKKSKR